ncbi:Cytochrome c oxidase subunit 1, partial [Trachymyrmex zeteki]
SGIVGASIRMIIRLELGTCGSLINNDQVYNSLITNHAFIMIVFMVMPLLKHNLTTKNQDKHTIAKLK